MKYYFVIFIIFCFLPGFNSAATTVKDIEAEASCVVSGISPEESQMYALKKARAVAIEKAAGLYVSSSSMVKNNILLLDYIKTYSKGLIVKEKITWFPLRQYQADASSPPLPEYKVKIVADVFIPQKKISPILLNSSLNKSTFIQNDKAVLKISTKRKSILGIFNFMANDRIVMLLPIDNHDFFLQPNQDLIIPDGAQINEFRMHTLDGHRKDIESFFVVALDEKSRFRFQDLFEPGQTLSFNGFFQKYSLMSEYCEDMMLPYEVIHKQMEE